MDTNIVDFRRTTGHGTITDGYYSAHESRFESWPASGFCGGAVQGPTPVTSLMRTAGATGGFSPSTPSARKRMAFEAEARNSSADAAIRIKRPVVAHQANTPSIRIGDYAKRRPEGYFHLPGKAPMATETAGHGGLFYNCQNYDNIVWSRSLSNAVPFGKGNGPCRAERLKNIEAIVKRAKIPERSAKKHL